MDFRAVDDLTFAIEAGLARAYGVPGPLPRQLLLLRGRMPARLRREARLLLDAADRARLPACADRIDSARILLAHHRVLAHARHVPVSRGRPLCGAAWRAVPRVNLVALVVVTAAFFTLSRWA